MSNIIQYKLWLVEDKCYVDDFYIDPYGEPVMYDCGEYETLYHTQYILCPLLGIDENNKPIYKDDILNYFSTNLNRYINTIIHNIIEEGVGYSECVVIGNIHENPQLLDNSLINVENMQSDLIINRKCEILNLLIENSENKEVCSVIRKLL